MSTPTMFDALEIEIKKFFLIMAVITAVLFPFMPMKGYPKVVATRPLTSASMTRMANVVFPTASAETMPVLVPVDSTQRLPGETGKETTQRLGVEDNTLWMARGIYTETDLPEEMETVGWFIRNRADSGYLDGKRGTAKTRAVAARRGLLEDGRYNIPVGDYRATVLAPSQFSEFISERSVRRYSSWSWEQTYKNGGLTEVERRRWIFALTAAVKVITAPDSARPMPITARHYYSSVSMKPSYSTYCHRANHTAAQIASIGRAHPQWAHDGRVVGTGPNPERFRFMELSY